MKLEKTQMIWHPIKSLEDVPFYSKLLLKHIHPHKNAFVRKTGAVMGQTLYKDLGTSQDVDLTDYVSFAIPIW